MVRITITEEILSEKSKKGSGLWGI